MCMQFTLKIYRFLGAFACDFLAIWGPAHYFLFNLEGVLSFVQKGSLFVFLFFSSSSFQSLIKPLK